jgi:hypothetical protein
MPLLKLFALVNNISLIKELSKSTLFPKIKQAQISGINALMAEFYKQGLTDIRQLAYIFATAYHETAATMQPIAEFGKGRGRKYGKKVRFNGTPYKTPNHIYYGRGHTQNTWIDNYEMLTRVNTQGWDFVNNPDLLLHMEPSVWATIYCMRRGSYTGKKLDDYIKGTKEDYINARRIINVLDRAGLIANYTLTFLNCLKLSINKT